MWMKRITEIISTTDSVIVVEAGEKYGFSYAVDRFRREQPHVLWMCLDPDDAGDKVQQGNKLADAVSQAFSSPLFGYGLPFAYGISVISQHLDVLAPITIVVSHAEYGTSLASALLSLARPDCRVILHFEHVPGHFECPRLTHHISSLTLQLTTDEAADLARGRLSNERLQALYSRSRGAYEAFLSLLNTELGMPPLARPSPAGEVPLSQIPTADSAGLFDALVASEQWVEALEFAVRARTDKVREIIDRAGSAYLSRGLFNNFWEIFKLLPTDLLADEKIAYWRYTAALTTNNHRHIESEVSEYLERHTAAELRALFAISIPKPSMVREAEKAHSARPNAVTTRALGFAHSVSGNPATGVDHLFEANRLATQDGDRHLIVATSNEIAVAHQLAGKYRDAFKWAFWALKQYTEFGMNEELRRLFIISEVAYPGLLIGRVEAVAALLDSISISSELYGIPSMEGVISTLADYALMRGQYDLAVHYARINYDSFPQDHRGYGTLGLVRALLAAGQTSEAIEMANLTHCSTHGVSEVEELRAGLALGIALAQDSPADSLPHLVRAQKGFRRLLSAPYLAQASIALAAAYLQLGQVEDARKSLAEGDPGLRELAESGWLLLGGNSEHMRAAWELWNEDAKPVELRFLGGRKIRIGHRTTDYPLRWCEILAVLAFHPDGLNGERLSSQLYGDTGNMSTLKSNVSRMRKDIPVSSRPYRIELPYSADFVQLDRELREGRVREAVELYQGPLLPESEAPFIVELRGHLEEALRQAALTSGDADILHALARRLGDDLELWEATTSKLSQNDPLLPLAKAHVKRISRSWGD
jgi:tetratricopeptide (TPR) repeat protein